MNAQELVSNLLDEEKGDVKYVVTVTCEGKRAREAANFLKDILLDGETVNTWFEDSGKPGLVDFVNEVRVDRLLGEDCTGSMSSDREYLRSQGFPEAELEALSDEEVCAKVKELQKSNSTDDNCGWCPNPHGRAHAT
jgi:hypothetical protein